jgi:hypothetical protein
MTVAEDVKTAFKGDRGKVLVVVGVGIVIYIWWTRSRTPSTPQDIVPADDGLHRTATAPGGSTGDSSSTGSATSTGRPTTNQQWLDQAVNILGNDPYNYSETAVYNAIQKAFLGQPISANEENWIRAAMRALGSPPEGMPPLNITAPPGNPQGNPPPDTSGKPDPVAGLHAVSGAFQQAPGGGLMNNYIDVSWGASKGATSYHLLESSPYGRTDHGQIQGTSFRVQGLAAPDTDHRITVWAVNSAGESAPRDTVVRTSGRFVGPRPPAQPF